MLSALRPKAAYWAVARPAIHGHVGEWSTRTVRTSLAGHWAAMAGQGDRLRGQTWHPYAASAA
jgi:hypothetical protein